MCLKEFAFIALTFCGPISVMTLIEYKQEVSNSIHFTILGVLQWKSCASDKNLQKSICVLL